MDTYSPKGNICGAIIPDFILERDLSHGAMLLYSILCNYARDKDHCWPSQPKLAQVLKCSLSSVKTYLAELVREKLILIHHSFCRSNIYYLLRPAELEKRQMAHRSDSARTQSEFDSPQPKSGYIRNIKNQEKKNSPLPPSRVHPTSSSGTSVEVRDSSSSEFEKLWEMYPKKEAKGLAQSAWRKLKKSGLLPSLEVLCAALRKFLVSFQWNKAAGQFIPRLAKWLNGHCWQDNPTAPIVFQAPEQPKDVVFQQSFDARVQQEKRESEERKQELARIRPEFEAFAAKFPTGSDHPLNFGRWSNLHKKGLAPTADDVPSDNTLNIVDFMNHFKAKHENSRPVPFPIFSRNIPDYSRNFPICGTLFTHPQRAVA